MLWKLLRRLNRIISYPFCMTVGFVDYHGEVQKL